MLGFDALGEIEQQFQLPIEGSAGEVIGWFEIKLSSTSSSTTPPTAHVPYTLPHFTYGSVIESAAPALITACVREWDIDDVDTVSGAKVAIGV
jgi:hypothetical protein